MCVHTTYKNDKQIYYKVLVNYSEYLVLSDRHSNFRKHLTFVLDRQIFYFRSYFSAENIIQLKLEVPIRSVIVILLPINTIFCSNDLKRGSCMEPVVLFTSLFLINLMETIIELNFCPSLITKI